ncbi:unnamed protein product [Prunus armeniaca]|uniref:Uncharacterized protein n=1 Tax=Prunus armeniaca TaxID=36596 RepID=A0A6J5TWX8_PRUAR|nr:unnamed protein product [Prunus armeniaca]
MGFTRRLDPSLMTLHCVLELLSIKNSADLTNMGMTDDDDVNGEASVLNQNGDNGDYMDLN